jgi:hypothetical protein
LHRSLLPIALAHPAPLAPAYLTCAARSAEPSLVLLAMVVVVVVLAWRRL